MLVCRDLEKAKDYEFEDEENFQLSKNVYGNIDAFIAEDDGAFWMTAMDKEYDFSYKNNCLDFIYDMIKDGVIEKVEE